MVDGKAVLLEIMLSTTGAWCLAPSMEEGDTVYIGFFAYYFNVTIVYEWPIRDSNHIFPFELIFIPDSQYSS